jgi:quinol monooxygenase YgiN
MVVATLRILPLQERRSQVLEILRSVQGPLLAQPGCAACDIYEEEGAAHAVVFVERFESDAALEAHLRSDTYGRLLRALELSEGVPDIRFERVLSSEGLELVERQRAVTTLVNGKGDQS